MLGKEKQPILEVKDLRVQYGDFVVADKEIKVSNPIWVNYFRISKNVTKPSRSGRSDTKLSLRRVEDSN